MKAVGPRRANAQRQIDLGVGMKRERTRLHFLSGSGGAGPSTWTSEVHSRRDLVVAAAAPDGTWLTPLAELLPLIVSSARDGHVQRCRRASAARCGPNPHLGRHSVPVVRPNSTTKWTSDCAAPRCARRLPCCVQGAPSNRQSRW
jgi:hypothetical protein